jgi:hypothetical protein
MKPIHKFNNGNGATLCHKCNCIISIGFTDDLYCKECIKEQDKKMYNEEDLKEAFLDGWQLRDGDLPFPKAKKKWFEQFKKK